jgi:glycosyltransferase involved in cell wall biosynthesis
MGELRSFDADAVWMSWERHRRSAELAAHLGMPCVLHLSRRRYLARVLWLSLRSAAFLARRRPRLVVVQNPSLVLATVACLLKRPLGFRLVVDRHSNFCPETLGSRSPVWIAYHALSRYTNRAADLTIVTNTPLAELVREWRGRPFVLPDKIPALSAAPAPRDPFRPSVVFICSHASDEPVREVLEAASLASEVTVYITGSGDRTRSLYRDLIPPNVVFTGFLAEDAYQSLLASSTAVVALTTMPNTLLCGAYEAVSLGKPLIVSDQTVLRQYFSKGRVLTDNSAGSIADAIRGAVTDAERLGAESRSLGQELTVNWQRQMTDLVAILDGFRGASPTQPVAGST